jgi:asparagine synthetase B (glutamine-hydrolysing)
VCGVVGVAGERCPEIMEAMLARIAHRGPDDSGIFD